MRYPFQLTTSLLALSILLAGCDSRSRPTAAPAVGPAPSVTSSSPSAIDSSADLPRLRQFLRWYLAFSERRDSSVAPLLRYPLPPAGPDRQAFLRQLTAADVSPTGYVVLNERRVATYLDSLRASNYFSVGFLARQAASLHQRGAALAAERETENGAMPGFEADEIFNAQDLYQPADIARLRVAPAAYQTHPAAPVYQLPLGPASFFLYTRQEQGRVVLDSIQPR